VSRLIVLAAALAALVCLDQGVVAQSAAPPSILISRQLAEAYGLSRGDTVRFSANASGADAREFRIADIYEPTPDPMELNASKFKARMHLPDLVTMIAPPDAAPGSETVDTLNIRLKDPEERRAFSRDLMARAPGIMARPIEYAATAGGTFVVIRRFHLAIALVTIVASTVFLLALSLMLVDERRETVGILRLIGFESRRVLVQVFVEGLIISVGGAVFGLLLALASQFAINRYFQWHYNTMLIFVRVTPLVWFECLLIAVPLGVTASVCASWALLKRHGLALARR
jgi:putative ABC transport system permease protein